MMNLLLDAFAAKRLTRLIVDDAILDDARNWAYDNIGDPQENKLTYLITCHACSSVWAAALVGSGVLPRWLRDTLALSEIVLAIQRLVDDSK